VETTVKIAHAQHGMSETYLPPVRGSDDPQLVDLTKHKMAFFTEVGRHLIPRYSVINGR
jgi:hypothetical protein